MKVKVMAVAVPVSRVSLLNLNLLPIEKQSIDY